MSGMHTVEGGMSHRYHSAICLMFCYRRVDAMFVHGDHCVHNDNILVLL